MTTAGITDFMVYDYFITHKKGEKWYAKRHTPHEFKEYVGDPIVMDDCIRGRIGSKHKNFLRKVFKEELDATLIHVGNQWTNTTKLMMDYQKRKVDPSIELKYWVKYNFPSQFIPSPSIYSPQVSLAIMKYYGFKGHLLTPTMGWGSWLMAAAHNQAITSYHGIDVVTSIITKSKTLANELGVAATFSCKPSEDVKASEMKLADNIIFSPPYFQLEIYPDDGNLTQSTSRYNELDKWIDGYWEPTMKLCSNVLRDDGTMCVIFKLNKDGKQMLTVLEDYFDVFDRKPFSTGGKVSNHNPETLFACKKL